jgi:N-succinyldiaminopimelate aminotransferase
MPTAVFSPVAHRIPELPGPVFPLHVGDTWMEPCEAARMEALRVAEHPGMHRYSATQGLPELVDALVEKLRDRNGLACEREGVLVCGGATAGLAAAVGAIADPGDEVLILAPFWPLVRGIAQALRARPVEVPFFDRVDSAAAAVAAVRERITPKSVALYFSSPSNPTGRVLPEAWLAELAELARRENLWLLSDEVYEDYVYRGAHVSIARFAPERTVSAFSFSKAYGMAGNRVGYLAGPPAIVAQAHKLGVHTVYHAPTASQLAALAALRHGAGWVRGAREAYRRAGAHAASALGLPAPEGSMFLFLDVRERLDARGMQGLLEDCLSDGVVVAPGASSGADYAGWIRLCYSSAPPDQVAEGVRRLARRLGRESE